MIAVTISVSACAPESAVPVSDDALPTETRPSTSLGEPPGDWYHAWLTGREPEPIPFFLHLPHDCDVAPATIVNGEERIERPCARSEEGVSVEFPVYGTVLTASFDGADRIVGTWFREQRAERELLMELSGRRVVAPDPAQRFAVDTDSSPAAPSVSVAGTWRMDFNLHGTAKGSFTQQPNGVVTGSVEVPAEYGDMRYLSGNVINETMYLSTFDGQSAFYLEGNVGSEAAMEGVWIFSWYWDEFVAERVEDFEFIDPLSRVRYDAVGEPFDIPALHQPRYDNKAVIVSIFGTWCPNCGDHAPLLAELYQAHNQEGLEILGLAFERSDDPDYIAERIAAFRDLHDMPWEIVVADATLEQVANTGFAGLSPIQGVPVTLFIKRDRTVHAVYTGFAGPAVQEAHERAIERFRQLTEEILDGG